VIGTAIALDFNSFGFPYFGVKLARRLTIVGPSEPVPRRVDWIVAAPELAPKACPGDWEPRRIGRFGWTVWERAAESACASPIRLRARPPA